MDGFGRSENSGKSRGAYGLLVKDSRSRFLGAYLVVDAAIVRRDIVRVEEEAFLYWAHISYQRT